MKSLLAHTLALTVLLACPFAAQALTEDEPLTMVFDVTEAARPPGVPEPLPSATPTTPCAYHVRNVRDARRNTETVGAAMWVFDQGVGVPMWATSIRSGDGLKWMRSALPHLGKYGVQITQGEGATNAPSTDVALQLAHAWTSGLNMHAHVVLTAHFASPQGETVKRYHGFSTKSNWNNGNGEYMTTLNLGMADALKNYAADLSRRCSQARAS